MGVVVAVMTRALHQGGGTHHLTTSYEDATTASRATACVQLTGLAVWMQYERELLQKAMG